MSTATETITIVLVHSTSGLLAEITGLPVQAGPEYLRKSVNRELAADALHAKYPQLVIRSATAQGETGYIFFVEPV